MEFPFQGVICEILNVPQLFTDNENPESWMKHAKGLGQLIKITGPDRYRNQIDITLLKASRGFVVRIRSVNASLF